MQQIKVINGVIINDFNKSMEGIGLYNKNKETFKLYGLEEKKYGGGGAFTFQKDYHLSILIVRRIF